MFWKGSREMSEFIADTLKCPHCAANLKYDGLSGKSVCNFCGSEFDPQLLRLSFAFENKSDESEIEDSGRQEITCNSCGATVITDENTSAAFCCYCGSPALVGHRLRREFKPDYIIPFKLTREEAEAKFMEWGRTNKYVPSDFMNEENIKKLTPLYVPFWLVDSKCDAEFYGTGKIYDKAGCRKTIFSLHRNLKFFLKRVPFVGAKKMNRLLMEAVEPYDYSELVPYNDAYLPGYYAERYNLRPADMAQNVIWRLESYARQSCNAMSFDYKDVDLHDGYIDISDCKYSYALLPIWFLNYQSEGVYHGFAINGQTGEACGKLPYSKIKRTRALALCILKWLVLPMLILIALGFALSPAGIILLSGAKVTEGFARLSAYTIYGIIFLGMGVGYAFLKVFRRKLKETTNPMDKAPDLAQYYDTAQKSEMVRDDDLMGIYQMSDDEVKEMHRRQMFQWIDKHF